MVSIPYMASIIGYNICSIYCILILNSIYTLYVTSLLTFCIMSVPNCLAIESMNNFLRKCHVLHVSRHRNDCTLLEERDEANNCRSVLSADMEVDQRILYQSLANRTFINSQTRSIIFHIENQEERPHWSGDSLHIS